MTVDGLDAPDDLSLTPRLAGLEGRPPVREPDLPCPLRASANSDSGSGRPAELFHESILPPAAADCVLRPKVRAYNLERGLGIVIESPHQARIYRETHVQRFEVTTQRCEMHVTFVTQ